MHCKKTASQNCHGDQPSVSGSHKASHNMRYDQTYETDHTADRYDHAGQDRCSYDDQKFGFPGIHAQCLCHVIAQQQYIQLFGKQQNHSNCYNTYDCHIFYATPGSST